MQAGREGLLLTSEPGLHLLTMSVGSTRRGMKGGWRKKRKTMKRRLQAARKIAVLPRASAEGCLSK